MRWQKRRRESKDSKRMIGLAPTFVAALIAPWAPNGSRFGRERVPEAPCDRCMRAGQAAAAARALGSPAAAASFFLPCRGVLCFLRSPLLQGLMRCAHRSEAIPFVYAIELHGGQPLNICLCAAAERSRVRAHTPSHPGGNNRTSLPPPPLLHMMLASGLRSRAEAPVRPPQLCWQRRQRPQRRQRAASTVAAAAALPPVAAAAAAAASLALAFLPWNGCGTPGSPYDTGARAPLGAFRCRSARERRRFHACRAMDAQRCLRCDRRRRQSALPCAHLRQPPSSSSLWRWHCVRPSNTMQLLQRRARRGRPRLPGGVPTSSSGRAALPRAAARRRR